MLVSGILMFWPALADLPPSALYHRIQESNHADLFPRVADYNVLESVCGDEITTTVLVFDSVTDSMKGVRRIVVFSRTGEYLGYYGGFNEAPVSFEGCDLIFPNAEGGDRVSFSNGMPPREVRVDGEIFEFQAAS